ncbi:uncharacterized protein LOC110433049 [Sorghum bicolor]|uniref:uncharacterized protein LOC110433049 n=1 Tax=Sorghum bicolor TaxID=4558 RepID=UPI000B4263C1|nr:uncharacterized protein LOC110433049 [Sorghum bicolor]|eukprot:XP_021310316.1 uncharacterized protein LOC110433049 [Sorghum bicolor]
MERGSPFSRSRAVEVEDGHSLGRLPPLAAAAHASHVLRSSQLDPGALPFDVSPGAERLRFSDSEASFAGDDSDASLSPVRPRGQRRRRRRRPRRGSRTVAAAIDPASVEPPARLASVVVHPARLSAEPDADGFRTVESRKRWRRCAAQRRPVPANLVAG